MHATPSNAPREGTSPARSARRVVAGLARSPLVLLVGACGAAACVLALARTPAVEPNALELEPEARPSIGHVTLAAPPAPQSRGIAFVGSDGDGALDLDRAQPRPARASRTEGDHLAVLRGLARTDPRAHERLVTTILEGPAPAYAQIAALRSLYEDGGAAAAQRIARAVARLPRTASPHAESVPIAFVHWLDRRASTAASARAVLDAIAFDSSTADDAAGARLRGQALRALARSTPDASLADLARRTESEHDPLVLEAGRIALRERAEPRPLNAFFEEEP